MRIFRKNISSSLRQRLTLQKEIQTSDTVGGYIRAWENVTDIWAEIIPLSGKERLLGGQLQSEVSHKVVMRYRSDVSAGMRILFEGRALNIISVVNRGEASELLEILAREGGFI